MIQLRGNTGLTSHETGTASPYLLGLLGFSLAGLALLTSPAIRARHTSPQHAITGHQ